MRGFHITVASLVFLVAIGATILSMTLPDSPFAEDDVVECG